MLVTVSGMVKAPVFPAGYVNKIVLALLYNTPSCELSAVLAASTVIVVRLVQATKTLSPMVVTLLGMGKGFILSNFSVFQPHFNENCSRSPRKEV
jgi:hypothetical protein